MRSEPIGGGPPSRVPEATPGIDLRSLPVGPREAFVISQIDGRANESDIAVITGIETPELAGILEHLADLEAIRLPGYRKQPAAAPAAPRLPAGGRDRPGLRHLLWVAAEDAIYDPFELEEACELPISWRKQILDLFYAVPYLDHYEALGERTAADKASLKRAYFEIVAFVHPDKYFGKQIGAFAPKLAVVFQRMGEAYDVLTRRQSRAEYDADLRARQAFAGQRATREPLSEPPAIASPDGVPPSAPNLQPPAALPPVNPPEPVGAHPLSSARPRRTSFGVRPHQPSRPASSLPAPPPRRSPSTIAAIQDEARAQMKRFYEQQRRQRESTQQRPDGGREQVERLLHLARDAVSEDRALCATNILRVAASLAPGRTDVAQELREAEAAASPQLAEQALRRAKELEGRGEHGAAAEEYRRAGSGRPEAWIFQRAADCLLRAAGDLREARDLARRAVDLAPDRAEYQVTLGKIYLAAGKPRSALAPLERAATLNPNEPATLELLRKARQTSRGTE